MHIHSISDATVPDKNEDLVTLFTHSNSVVDLLMIDGASSVAEKNYIDAANGDVIWFVSQFSENLRRIANPSIEQETSIQLALTQLRKDFLCHAGSADMPGYAYPIAALSWLRMTESSNAITLELYALGDCKTCACQQDGQILELDPYTNPQENLLRQAISKLKSEGVPEDKRREHLLPMLRARREFQNFNAPPDILCIDPRGPLHARTYRYQLGKPSTVLAMTDGFYRLADTYHLYTPEELLHSCATKGLPALLQQLREFEADYFSKNIMSVKKADDASAALCVFA